MFFSTLQGNNQAAEGPFRTMRQPTILVLISGSFIFLLLGLLVTVGIPALDKPAPTAIAAQYNEVQLEGRAVYIREGCMYCHTQQVRAVEVDRGTVIARGDIGAESVPGDYVYQKPVLWGTNRQGPDLSHVSSHSYATKEWHVNHLKDPRGNWLAASLMPSFAHLSDRDLDALAEYLLTLR